MSRSGDRKDRKVRSHRVVDPGLCHGLEEVVGVGEAYGVSGANGRVRIASNQMLLNSVRTSLLTDPATKFALAGQHRRKDSPQRIDEPFWCTLHTDACVLLIPHLVRIRVIT